MLLKTISSIPLVLSLYSPITTSRLVALKAINTILTLRFFAYSPFRAMSMHSAMNYLVFDLLQSLNFLSSPFASSAHITYLSALSANGTQSTKQLSHLEVYSPCLYLISQASK